MATLGMRARDRALAIALPMLVPLVLVVLFIHVAWGMLVAGFLFPVLPRRATDWLVRFWSRIVLVMLGIRLEVDVAPGAPSPEAARGALLLINHISWVDVFVVAAVIPARFVAKSEIAAWPVLGRFTRFVGTIFVARGRRHAVAQVNDTVAARLRSGQSIGIFPEGTTTDGSQLLRFHANLVQAALEAQAPVVPVGLKYLQDGERSAAAAYIGEMNLAQSLWRILIAPRLTVRLHWLPAVAHDGLTRHAIAREAQAAVGRVLDLDERAVQETEETEGLAAVPPGV